MMSEEGRIPGGRPGRRAVRTAGLLTALAWGALACGGSAGDGAGAGATEDAAAGGGAEGGQAARAGGAVADSAELLAERAMEWLGGAEAWESTRFVAFDWIVARPDEPFVRSHAWDRYDGDYRLETVADGDSVVALFDVNAVTRDSTWGKVPAGNVWVGGERLAGAARDSALAAAYGAFINDTYWLLMPFKWRDPGVHLAYEGRRDLDDDQEVAVVQLTFEPDLGVTNDRYWAFVEPESGRMVAWQYHLEGRDEPGAVIRWSGWREVGPIRLAADRVWPDGRSRITFERLRADTAVPEGTFEPPSAP